MLLHSSHTVTPQKESELTQKWVICDKLLKRCLRSDNGDDGYYILIFMYLHVRKREISCFLRSCWHKFLDRKLYCWRRGNHLSKNSTDSSVCLWTLFAQFLLFHSLCFLIMGYVEVSKNKSYDCVRKLQTFCINCISGSNSNIIQLCYPKQHQNFYPLSFWNPKYKCIYYCQHCTSLLEIQTKEFLWKEMKWSRTRGV